MSGRLFTKGGPGGPGRPKGTVRIPEALPIEVVPKKELTKEVLRKTINKYLFMPHDELRSLVDTKVDSLDMMIAMIIYNAFAKGDAFRAEWIMQRMLGKVTEQIEVDLPQATIIHLIGDQSGQKVVLGAKLPGDQQPCTAASASEQRLSETTPIPTS